MCMEWFPTSVTDVVPSGTGKIEVLWVRSAITSSSTLFWRPAACRVNQTAIKPSSVVGDVGSWLDAELSMRQRNLAYIADMLLSFGAFCVHSQTTQTWCHCRPLCLPGLTIATLSLRVSPMSTKTPHWRRCNKSMRQHAQSLSYNVIEAAWSYSLSSAVHEMASCSAARICLYTVDGIYMSGNVGMTCQGWTMQK